MHEHPVVAIERHEISDRSQRHEIEQIRDGRRVEHKPRACISRVSAAIT